MKKIGGIPGEVAVEVPACEESCRLGWMRPYVRQSGSQVREPWYLGARKLLDYLLVYIESGDGVFTVGEETFQVGDNTWVWIPPDTVHVMRGTSRMRLNYLHFDLLYDRGRSHWNAMIPAGLLDLSVWSEWMHPPVSDDEIGSWCGRLLSPQDNMLAALMEKICVKHGRDRACGLALSGMMLQLLDGLIKQQRGNAGAGGAGSLMAEVRAFLQKNCESALSMTYVARKFGYSESHLRRLFSDQFAMSPQAFYQSCRFERACELLVYENRRVSEVAVALGYENVCSFSRSFKKALGVSPKSFRTKKN